MFNNTVEKKQPTNINIFSMTHIPRSFTDRIRRTQKYIQKLEDTLPSRPIPPYEENRCILPTATVGILSPLLPL